MMTLNLQTISSKAPVWLVLLPRDHVDEVVTGKTRFISKDPIEAQGTKRAPTSISDARRSRLTSALSITA